MAVYYVDDGGSNTSPYDTFDKAANSITSITVAAGDTVYIEKTHAETSSTASFQFGMTGQASAQGDTIKYICVDRTTASDTSTVGGSADADYAISSVVNFETTGGNYDINFQGSNYVAGIWVKSIDKIYCFTDGLHYHEDVCYDITGAGSLDTVGPTGNDCVCIWIRPRFKFGNTGHKVNLQTSGLFRIEGPVTAEAGHVAFNNFTSAPGSNITRYEFMNVDFSTILSSTGKIFIGWPSNSGSGAGHIFQLTNVKYPASGSIIGGSPGERASRMEAYNVTSGTNLSGIYVEDYYGILTEDETYTRNATWTETATDDYSLKIVTNTTPSFWEPFRYQLAPFYAGANATIRIDFQHASAGSGTGSKMNNDEVWFELIHPTSGSNVGTKLSKRVALNATPGLVQTGVGSGWAGSLGSAVPEYVEWTVTGGQAGMHYIVIYQAIASATVYYDPNITVT